MSEGPLRLAVFDVDGTLIDSQNMIMEAMRRAFDGLGLPLPDRQQVLSIVGLSLDRAFARLVPDLDAAGLDHATALYKQSFMGLRAEAGGDAAAPLYPGARAALEVLAGDAGLLLGVATGKSRRGLIHMFEAHDLGRFFVTSQTADDHPSKPHPAMLQATLAETGAEPAQAVMIGDTSFDMDMGRAAGFATIGVSWGYHPRTELAADRVIDDFAELPGALAEIWEDRA